jgi:hypothetical protein
MTGVKKKYSASKGTKKNASNLSRKERTTNTHSSVWATPKENQWPAKRPRVHPLSFRKDLVVEK